MQTSIEDRSNNRPCSRAPFNSNLRDCEKIWLSAVESLRALYCTAMRFEAAFFSEQDGAPQLPPLALLGVDFDETCSRGDTIAAVIAAAIDAAAARGTGARLPQETGLNLWELSKAEHSSVCRGVRGCYSKQRLGLQLKHGGRAVSARRQRGPTGSRRPPRSARLAP